MLLLQLLPEEACWPEAEDHKQTTGGCKRCNQREVWYQKFNHEDAPDGHWSIKDSLKTGSPYGQRINHENEFRISTQQRYKSKAQSARTSHSRGRPIEANSYCSSILAVQQPCSLCWASSNYNWALALQCSSLRSSRKTKYRPRRRRWKINKTRNYRQSSRRQSVIH